MLLHKHYVVVVVFKFIMLHFLCFTCYTNTLRLKRPPSFSTRSHSRNSPSAKMSNRSMSQSVVNQMIHSEEELRSCCSPIGQNNTKDCSAQSGGSIGRVVWKWSGKSRFPGALSALLVNLRRFISLPDLFPLAPSNRPWVSEDATSSEITGIFLKAPSLSLTWENSHKHLAVLCLTELL